MLTANNEYTVTVMVNGEALTGTFLSEFSPAYTTPRRIRSRYGVLLVKATDIELWEVIYDASLELDYQTRDLDEVDPYLRERAVACRAAITWIRQNMIKDAWDQTSQKVLGDLTVRDDGTSPADLLKLLDNLQEECKRWWAELIGSKAKGLAVSDWAEWQPSIQVANRSWT